MDELKRTISIAFAILFLLSLLLVNKCKIIAKAAPLPPIIVDDDGVANFTKIQDAVNNATSGSTIFVRNGTYHENVVVNKTVSLIGESREDTIVDCLRVGSVFVVIANNVSISNFTVRNSGLNEYDSGIRLEPSSDNVISHNRMTGNTIGISLFSSSNTIISDNDVSSNGLHAIYIYSSDTNTISSNYVSSRNYGISLYSSNNHMISNNIVYSDTYVGVNLYSSDTNVFMGNTILNNNFTGIVFYSNNNTFYHNNFINSTNPFFIQSSENFWDDGNEGNYWSDYIGQDLNKDGIGDTPYLIDETNQDNHPLVGTFSSFIATLKGEPYQIATLSNATIANFRFGIGTETGNKIISFNVICESNSIGFCRITIPNALMRYPYIMLIDGDEASPTLLDSSNETHTYLYFTCFAQNQAVTIIYSETQHLYEELHATYLKMQADLNALNTTYNALLNNYLKLETRLSSLNLTYTALLNSYLSLQVDLQTVNATYYNLLNNYLKLQLDFQNLNVTSSSLLNSYSILLNNYSELLESFDELNASYNEHLSGYSGQAQNLQNLMYIFASATAIFLMATIYLSKRAHEGSETKNSVLNRKVG